MLSTDFGHDRLVSSRHKNFRTRDAVECSNVFLQFNLIYLFGVIKVDTDVWAGHRVLRGKANAAGENSSIIFTVCIKFVPLYHFKLAYVVLHMTVKEFFEPRF